VWEETGAKSPDQLQKLLVGRSLKAAGLVGFQTLLDAGQDPPPLPLSATYVKLRILLVRSTEQLLEEVHHNFSIFNAVPPSSTTAVSWLYFGASCLEDLIHLQLTNQDCWWFLVCYYSDSLLLAQKSILPFLLSMGGDVNG